MPEGYELRSVYYMGNSALLSYEFNDSYIYFNYSLADGSSITVDNEKHNFAEITGKHTTYYYYSSSDNDYSTVIWFDKGYAYSIDAQISQDEFVKMAESIIF